MFYRRVPPIFAGELYWGPHSLPTVRASATTHVHCDVRPSADFPTYGYGSARLHVFGPVVELLIAITCCAFVVLCLNCHPQIFLRVVTVGGNSCRSWALSRK